MLIIPIMIQVDMRFIVRNNRNNVKNTKCFYLNIADYDAKISCGCFLYSYGEVILNHLSRKRMLMNDWGTYKTNFPMKLSYKVKEHEPTLLDKINKNKIIDLKNEDSFFEMEKIPDDESDAFAENVTDLFSFSETTSFCDLTSEEKKRRSHAY